MNVDNVVFMFWGTAAKNFRYAVDIGLEGRKPNLCLLAPHPVAGVYTNPPTSEEDDNFLNCHHFSKANEYLFMNRRGKIDWTIPNKSNQ